MVSSQDSRAEPALAYPFGDIWRSSPNLSSSRRYSRLLLGCFSPQMKLSAQRGEDKERGSARGRTLRRGEIGTERSEVTTSLALWFFPSHSRPSPAGSARWHFPPGTFGEAPPIYQVHAAIRGFFGVSVPSSNEARLREERNKERESERKP